MIGAFTASVQSRRTTALKRRASSVARPGVTSTPASLPGRLARAASAGPAASGPTSTRSPTTAVIVAATRSAVTTWCTKVRPNSSKAMCVMSGAVSLDEHAVGAPVDRGHALVAVDAQAFGGHPGGQLVDEVGLAQQRPAHGHELEALGHGPVHRLETV